MPNYGGPSRDFLYEGPSYGYTSNPSTSGLGIKSNGISRANINTSPLVSTFARNTNSRDFNRNPYVEHDGRESCYSPSRVFREQSSLRGPKLQRE